MTVPLHSERLYLQRDSSLDLYIDLHKPLPQHQIDGIRFLYRHYKKKTPGVILNDPSGYGKCYQVVSFLDALRPVIKKPILILSNDVNNWKEQFDKIWKNCDQELSIGAPMPLSKKFVHINPVVDAFTFAYRSWSVVVLHGLIGPRDLPQSFTADYKVWVTSTDLKENLRALSSIYEWLHPNQKFNIDNFIPNKYDATSKLYKALQLESFLEDFLIRRSNFDTPFQKNKDQTPAPPIESPPKTTRKNKDPTGTKVKRSRKRIIEEDNTDEQNVLFAKRNTPSNGNDVEANKSKTLDVENFILNEKPISSEGFTDVTHDSNGSSESITVTVNTNGKNLDFDNILKAKVSDNTPDAKQNNSALFTENNSKSGKEVEDETDIPATSKIIVPGTEESEDSPTILLYTETDDNNPGIDENNVTKNITIIPETEQSEDTPKLQYENDNSNGINATQNSTKTGETEENNDKNIEASGDIEKGNDDMDSRNSKTSTAKDGGSVLSDMDAKLAEYEAMALKKFKGTFLDRLF